MTAKLLDHEDCEINLLLRENDRDSPGLWSDWRVEPVVTALVQALASNRTVELLHINMPFGPDSVWSELVRSLKSNTHLRHLFISVADKIPLYWPRVTKR